MIEIKVDEGLCEQIRRIENEIQINTAQQNDSLLNIAKNVGITIMENEKFIKKFMDSLPDEYK